MNTKVLGGVSLVPPKCWDAINVSIRKIYSVFRG